MAVLLTLRDIAKSFGAHALFERLSLSIGDGDRLGLIGPNGSGKSTLLKILAGQEQPDSGSRVARQLARIGYVPQEPSFTAGQSVRAIVTEASVAGDAHLEAGERAGRVEVVLGKVGFRDMQQEAGGLSGGWRKRLAIAAALVRQPDLLLLDEPTNHLDLDGIEWLDGLLQSAPFSCVVVTHDRYFLDDVATRMAEIDRAYPDGLLYIEAGYEEFLEKKELFLEAQARQQESLANQVRHELEWLKRGPKARTRKAQARIDAAGRLMQELADVNARMRTAFTEIDFSASGRRTKRLVVARGLEKSLGGRALVSNLDLVLSPGMRLGLVGPNGSGKTTLLRILAGELAPDNGTIERAPALQTVMFDQHREQLDLDASLKRALSPAGDSVIYRGRPIHVAGWAKRFLFRPDQLEQPLRSLSGGERARVLIARLMLRSADLLLLDEPTNDLDIPTLETLEESLLDFPGALVLVTHDRYMLDRVSNVVLGLDGEGRAEFFADYSQWEQVMQQRRAGSRAARLAAPRAAPGARPRKLSYQDQREWDQMEERILAAEAQLEDAERRMNDPANASNAALLAELHEKANAARIDVERLYARWAELEAKLAPAE